MIECLFALKFVAIKGFSVVIKRKKGIFGGGGGGQYLYATQRCVPGCRQAG